MASNRKLDNYDEMNKHREVLIRWKRDLITGFREGTSSYPTPSTPNKHQQFRSEESFAAALEFHCHGHGQDTGIAHTTRGKMFPFHDSRPGILTNLTHQHRAARTHTGRLNQIRHLSMAANRGWF